MEHILKELEVDNLEEIMIVYHNYRETNGKTTHGFTDDVFIQLVKKLLRFSRTSYINPYKLMHDLTDILKKEWKKKAEEEIQNFEVDESMLYMTQRLHHIHGRKNKQQIYYNLMDLYKCTYPQSVKIVQTFIESRIIKQAM